MLKKLLVNVSQVSFVAQLLAIMYEIYERFRL